MTYADIAHWSSVATVARTHSVTVQGIYGLLRRGRLQGVRTDVGWLVDPKSVNTWAAARRKAKAHQQGDAAC
jgi:hypothetical protein